ncbi:MAG: hypothetical protein COB20_06755 [SAR86 cluster bacterium]|uniref:RNA polymerase sigma factor n=1 Tax=SAR86 cluster bacterium TaxID=2030880 RepID=A0A2A4X6U4_9GAMM|nr:MAG: hypothetical protein COB20_06755 [SAR86 cluster bacterium]
MNKPVLVPLQIQSSDINEDELLREIVRGDRTSFRVFFDIYKRDVFTTAHRLLNDISDAEDASQEVFLNAFRNIGQFERKSSLRTWLRKITVNLCINRLKSREFRGKKNSVEIDEERLSYTPLSEDASLIRTIDKVVDSLPSNTKTVFVLKAQQGLRHEEIAYLMDITIGTSKSQYAHARLLLRERLSFLKEDLLDEV